jgi:hypothetical protein
MEKVYTGKDHSIWKIDETKNGLVEQMLPLKCTKAFRRGYPNKIDMYNMGGWDCDCGIYVIGTVADVEKAFEELFFWMKSRTDKPIINDLAESDAVDYLSVFKSKKQDIAVIIGGGYYEETDEDFLNILNELKNVSVGELGANYSNDQDLYRVLLEDIDYIDYQKKEKINTMHIAVMSEVFKYWEENDIYTKADRIEDGLTNVDHVIDKYCSNK